MPSETTTPGFDQAVRVVCRRANTSRVLSLSAETAVFALAAAALVILVLRLGFGVADVGFVVLSSLGLIVVVGLIRVAMTAHRSWSRPEPMIALLDSRLHAGGTFLTGTADRGAWLPTLERLQTRRSSPLPRWQLLGASLTLAISFLLPIPEAEQTSATQAVSNELDRLREDVSRLAEIEAIDEDELERLERLIDQADRNAENADSSSAWEAVDFAEDETREAAEDAASDLAARAAEAQSYADLFDAIAQADPELAKELAQAALEANEQTAEASSLPKDVQEALREAAKQLAQSNLTQSQREQLAQEAAQAAGVCSMSSASALKQMGEYRLIDASSLQKANALALDRNASLKAFLAECEASGQCQSSALVACLMPGRGGVNRGPGHAQLTFTNDSGMDGSAFMQQRLDANSLDASQSVLSGMGAFKPGDLDPGEVSAGGALNASRAGGATAQGGVTLPVHRAAVREYFERQRSDDSSDSQSESGASE